LVQVVDEGKTKFGPISASRRHHGHLKDTGRERIRLKVIQI
jgi:hypothetical protein